MCLKQETEIDQAANNRDDHQKLDQRLAAREQRNQAANKRPRWDYGYALVEKAGAIFNQHAAFRKVSPYLRNTIDGESLRKVAVVRSKRKFLAQEIFRQPERVEREKQRRC